MKVEFRGVSTASLGAMLKGYGVMAGVGAAWPDARFWWTPTGVLSVDVAELDDCETATAHEAICDHVFELGKWASDRGEAFGKARRKTKKQEGLDGRERTIVLQEAGAPPLENEVTWDSLEAALAADAEGATAAHNSLRLLLAPLDDSGWIEKFRLRRTAGGKVDKSSAKLAPAKTRFDEAVHAAIDAPVGTNHVAVLQALWDLQLTLWKVSEPPEAFRAAPLLKGRAWGRALSELLQTSPAARLGWALASLGWAPVTDDDGQRIKRPVVEQLLPVTSDDQRGLRIPEPLPRQRVSQPGHNPARELAALFWRRWLDTASLPVLPATGTRPAGAADVNSLLWGDVSVKDLQRYFLAFLLLDGSGEAPRPASERRPVAPAYASLRLWLDLSARPMPGERRPMDGAVPRGVATGTASSIASACRVALRRLRMAGLPGDWPDGARPSGKSVPRLEVDLSPQQARLMAAALLVPVSEESVARLANTLLVPSASREPKPRSTMETAHV